MARLLAVILGCVSLVYLQLPGALSGGPVRGPRPLRPREPPARTRSGSLQPRHPAPWAVVWKPRQVPQPNRKASQAPAMGQHLRNSGQRHPGPRRTQAQLLRVGCVLGTCQVQNLSHRLWQLVRPAGRQDSAPIDPSSPHSYG